MGVLETMVVVAIVSAMAGDPPRKVARLTL